MSSDLWMFQIGFAFRARGLLNLIRCNNNGLQREENIYNRRVGAEAVQCREFEVWSSRC